MMKVRRSLLALHLLVGVGAIFGGLAAIIDPYSPLGMPVEALAVSPFTTFLIPGIILFAFLGLGNIFGAALFRSKALWACGYAGGVMGGGLAVWIVVQCLMLRAVAALHVIFFALGLTQGALSAALLYAGGYFPFNILKRYLMRGKGK